MPDKPILSITSTQGVDHEPTDPLVDSQGLQDDTEDDTTGGDNRSERRNVFTADSSANTFLNTESPLLICHVSNGSLSNGTKVNSGEIEAPVLKKGVKSNGDGETNLVYGWGLLSPRVLQFMLDRRMFLVVFIVSCILQGMYQTYLVSVLTTIESLFGFQSATIALVFCATEIGQIGGSFFISYYGGQGHRPRWIAYGTLLFALCVLFCSLPHFIYDVGNVSGHLSVVNTPAQESSLVLGSDDSGVNSGGNDLIDQPLNLTYLKDVMSLCRRDNSALETSLSSLDKSSNSVDSICDSNTNQSNFNQRQRVVFSLMFLALFGVGIGQIITSTLGITYIDDNVTNHESPIYFAFVIGLRVFGPVLGFLLGSQCMSIYVYPGQQNLLQPGDTNWVGAWWLGMIIISGLLFFDSVVILGYPLRLSPVEITGGPVQTVSSPLPHSPPSSATANGLIGFSRAVLQLLSNDIFVFRSISSVLHILPISGLYFFLPKFVQTQFDVTAGVANAISGLAGILVMFPAVMASGVCIKYVRPSLSSLSSWTALCALVYSLGMVLLMFVGCSQPDIHGLNSSKTSVNAHNLDLYNMTSCWSACQCDPISDRVTPVCVGGQIMFSSPCHAGCRSKQSSSLPHKVLYEDCVCSGLKNSSAVEGFCSSSCDAFHWFIMIFVALALTHATSDVGSMLVTLRCVRSEQKPLALSFIGFAISIFANVPCPVIYGAVVDSTCIQWTSVCGGQGSCLLYDKTQFRQHFFGLTALLMLLACVVDLIVWHKCRRRELSGQPANVPMQCIETINSEKQQSHTENDPNPNHVIYTPALDEQKV